MNADQIAKFLDVIGAIETALVGAINVADATGEVSNIVAGHIAAGDNTWTDEERNIVTDALGLAFDKADAQVTAAGADAMFGHLSNWWIVNSRPKLPHAPVFEVFRGAVGGGGGEWYYRERVSGRVTSTGGEDYYSKGNAKRAAYAHAARIDGSTVVVLD